MVLCLIPQTDSTMASNDGGGNGGNDGGNTPQGNLKQAAGSLTVNSETKL